MTDGLGTGPILAVGLYLTAILVVGYTARRRRASDSLSEFYLAGRQLSGPVLLLTLYATQYSGNTLFGFTGKTFGDISGGRDMTLDRIDQCLQHCYGSVELMVHPGFLTPKPASCDAFDADPGRLREYHVLKSVKDKYTLVDWAKVI